MNKRVILSAGLLWGGVALLSAQGPAPGRPAPGQQNTGAAQTARPQGGQRDAARPAAPRPARPRPVTSTAETRTEEAARRGMPAWLWFVVALLVGAGTYFVLQAR